MRDAIVVLSRGGATEVGVISLSSVVVVADERGGVSLCTGKLRDIGPSFSIASVKDSVKDYKDSETKAVRSLVVRTHKLARLLM